MRNSRDQRAMSKRGRHGRRVQEAEWKNAEVDALYLLAGVGVRVPMPYLVHEGVLLMEMVCDAEGHPAPRLNDVEISADQAREWHAFMISQIVRMLCAGLIHGDLSDFNVLVGAGGPVIIDLPQAVHAAGNNNAFAMLERDVNNMRAAFGRSAPELLETEYAREILEALRSRRIDAGYRPVGTLCCRHDRSGRRCGAGSHRRGAPGSGVSTAAAAGGGRGIGRKAWRGPVRIRGRLRPAVDSRNVGLPAFQGLQAPAGQRRQPIARNTSPSVSSLS